MQTKHKALPLMFNQVELSGWLKANAIEEFDEEIKRYFTPEEIADFEHESSVKGREINRIEAMLKEVSDAVKKGTETGFVIEIPATDGTKLLIEHRKQNDDFVETGYETETVRVFGIVDSEDETVEYFTAEGLHIASRSRGLTPKEKMKYLINTPVRNIAVNE